LVQLLAKEYEPKGAIFAFVSGGEDEGALMDYLKHYRSESVGLVDFDYKMQSAYHARGWPQAVIIGPDGYIRLHVPMISRDEPEARRILDTLCRGRRAARKEVLPGAMSAGPAGHRDFLPRAAVDDENRLWVVFTSNRDGNNNIYLRCPGAKETPKDIRVTESPADDYSPDIAASPDGSLWTAWVSNQGKKYDIYMRRFKDGRWSQTVPITQSDDDAFHPRIGVDDKGRVCVTYYKWIQRSGRSRDRDVYARFYDGRSLSKEVEVSPPEPKGDDHTDPSIAVDSHGSAWIAWSCDYHPELYQTPEDADAPTIFAQKLAGGRKMGGPLLVGTRGAANHAIDLLPSIAIGPRDEVWCAWDGTKRHLRFALANQARPGATAFGQETYLSDENALASRPAICVDKSGTPHAVWRQYMGAHWALVGSHGPKGRWTEPAPWVKDEGDCRNPMILADREGALWLVYEHQMEKDTEVLVRNVPR
jgi:hypothetical protein